MGPIFWASLTLFGTTCAPFSDDVYSLTPVEKSGYRYPAERPLILRGVSQNVEIGFFVWKTLSARIKVLAVAYGPFKPALSVPQSSKLLSCIRTTAFCRYFETSCAKWVLNWALAVGNDIATPLANTRGLIQFFNRHSTINPPAGSFLFLCSSDT